LRYIWKSSARRLFRQADGVFEADITNLIALKPLAPHIYELFRKFGIYPKQTDEVISLMSSQTGKYVYTATHRILADRGRIMITEREKAEETD